MKFLSAAFAAALLVASSRAQTCPDLGSCLENCLSGGEGAGSAKGAQERSGGGSSTEGGPPSQRSGNSKEGGKFAVPKEGGPGGGVDSSERGPLRNSGEESVSKETRDQASQNLHQLERVKEGKSKPSAQSIEKLERWKEQLESGNKSSLVREMEKQAEQKFGIKAQGRKQEGASDGDNGGKGANRGFLLPLLLGALFTSSSGGGGKCRGSYCPPMRGYGGGGGSIGGIGGGLLGDLKEGPDIAVNLDALTKDEAVDVDEQEYKRRRKR